MPEGDETQRDDFIRERRIQAEIMLKYGLTEQAIEQLEMILAVYPSVPEVEKLLADAYGSAGRTPPSGSAIAGRGPGAPAAAAADALQLEDFVDFSSLVSPDAQSAPESSPPGTALRDSDLAGTAGPVEPLVEISADEFAGFQDAFSPDILGGLEVVKPETGPGEAFDLSAASEGGPAFLDFDVRPVAAESVGGRPGREPIGDPGLPSEGIEFSFTDEQVADPPKENDSATALEFEVTIEEDAAAPAAPQALSSPYAEGLRLLEEGNPRDAAAAFEQSIRDGEKLGDSRLMLGRCYRRLAEPRTAISWYEKALEQTEEGSGLAVEILYEMGEAHEVTGDIERALEIFIDVFGLDADYKDVSQKLESLENRLKEGDPLE